MFIKDQMALLNIIISWCSWDTVLVFLLCDSFFGREAGKTEYRGVNP